MEGRLEDINVEGVTNEMVNSLEMSSVILHVKVI